MSIINKQRTMNDNWYYSQMTTEELTKVVNDNSYLEGYRNRCKQELTKRIEL